MDCIESLKPTSYLQNYFDLISRFFRNFSFVRRFLLEAKFFQILFRHQVLVHPAAQVVLGLGFADVGGVLVPAQADHVLQELGFALSVVIQRERPLFGRRALESLGTEDVRRHLKNNCTENVHLRNRQEIFEWFHTHRFGKT